MIIWKRKLLKEKSERKHFSIVQIALNLLLRVILTNFCPNNHNIYASTVSSKVKILRNIYSSILGKSCRDCHPQG